MNAQGKEGVKAYISCVAPRRPSVGILSLSDIVTQSLFIRIAMIQTSQNYEKIKKQRGFWREASFVLRIILVLHVTLLGLIATSLQSWGGCVYKNLVVHVVFEKT